MNICVIPARGGSKRIPGKNIKVFNGKPIIAYSIEAAKASDCFDRIIVSTDDESIIKIAREWGAEAPFIRPDDLSNDYEGTMPVVKHAIEWLIQEGEIVDDVCCLYATAPFITDKRIVEAYDKLKRSEAEYCFTAASFPYPVQRAFFLTENNRLQMLNNDHYDTRSQDLPEAYHDAGQLYWGTAEAFIQNKQVFSDIATPYILPRHLVQDIDTPEDWNRAELMYQLISERGMF